MPRAGLSAAVVTDAGAQLADELGFDAVTAAEVARRLGVRTASLYSHVRNSEDLKARISRLALQELADRVAEGIAGRSGVDALAGLAEAYRRYARGHPGRFAATLWPGARDDATVAAGRRHTQLAEAVLRGYPIQPDAVPHAVRFVGSTLRGFTDLDRQAAFAHSHPSPDDSWPVLVAALDAALRNWPSPDRTPKEPTR